MTEIKGLIGQNDVLFVVDETTDNCDCCLE